MLAISVMTIAFISPFFGHMGENTYLKDTDLVQRSDCVCEGILYVYMHLECYMVACVCSDLGGVLCNAIYL